MTDESCFAASSSPVPRNNVPRDSGITPVFLALPSCISINHQSVGGVKQDDLTLCNINFT